MKDYEALSKKRFDARPPNMTGETPIITRRTGKISCRDIVGQIKDLPIGAPVQFIDANGRINRYVVDVHDTLGKYDVEEMLSDGWDLTLFTCTYGGESRVTVRLKSVLTY